MNENPLLDSDLTYIQYQEPEFSTSTSIFTGGAPGTPIITIAGAVGPTVTFGGTTGLTFISPSTSVITVAGTLVVANGGTGRTTLTNHGVLIGAATSGINATSAGTAGQVLTSNGAAADPTFQAGSGGTVTSFSATPAGIFDVATATTTPALSLDNQAANIVLAGPSTGAAATPAFRALVGADLPQTAWASWSPTWVNLSVGDGTVTAKYALLPDKTVVARVCVVFGSTTAISGDVTFTLPVTRATYAGTAGITALGIADFYDSGVAMYYGKVINLSTTTAGFRVSDTSGTYETAAAPSSTVPFTWVTNDELIGQFFYEAA